MGNRTPDLRITSASLYPTELRRRGRPQGRRPTESTGPRSQIGFRADDPDIAHGVTWFIDNQEGNGLRNTGRNRLKNRHSDLWVGLAVCRMLNAVWASEK